MIREHQLAILLLGVMGCAGLSEELFLAGAFRVGRHEHPPHLHSQVFMQFQSNPSQVGL